jgi:2-polyprenyl-6-methoxyphenol hydroxylase-like FAD-dependent oxidoreductase
VTAAGRGHALVLGASIAGLLSARVLAECYDRVTVIDRDVLADDDRPRRGVPQGRHIHGLQPRGQRILEELFPGFTASLAADGANVKDTVADGDWFFNGHALRKAPSDLVTLAASRPFLERHVRDRVRALDNVEVVAECEAVDLLAADGDTTVTGARVVRAGGEPEPWAADLVVDATGRGGRTPVWLRQLGFDPAPEERRKIGMAYATRRYRLPPGAHDIGGAILVIASPSDPRGALCAKAEHDLVIVSAYGVLGEHPPTDPEGFTAFLKSLPVLEPYELAQAAEPLDDPVRYSFPAAQRRRYERLSRLPDGLLVLGDAVCSLNPTYAQGMTVAALGALVLRDHLRAGTRPRPVRFQGELARGAVDPAWESMLLNDLRFPGVAGRRGVPTRIVHAYLPLVQWAATRDDEVALTLLEVMSIVAPPAKLMAPRTLARVLSHARSRPRATGG